MIPLNYRTRRRRDGGGPVGHRQRRQRSPPGNQLIVNAEPAKIRELQSVLQQIDSRPHRLLITVDTSENLQQDSRGYSVDGSASAGNIEIQSGRGEVNGRIESASSVAPPTAVPAAASRSRPPRATRR